ncbi:MAG: Type 4 prepilin-like protein leader peptide-processing enzyme [Candidatus Amesbacteria bacterium GW2011_GWA2_42_12]|uniref:Type 4 prepilin-like protein leader peptide-processing enzyme n=1 Tax=Candidatus Amesbacteria bacterium GW2011_GWA2_42_12 TaxID=1618356 RepID=A0A0G1B4Q0_9BACT|nr:MAG: Type 4 prepilin-like protein leader peptide-processing enzyme [Candidatus Amesbacteria bacterium GW2011_GWA2_42_12]
MTIGFFVLGIILGSVANAVIYRLLAGRQASPDLSWWRGRSICPKCKHKLGFWDLIPLLSFLFLRGKCRYCHSPISLRYFLVELFLGAAFVFVGIHYSVFSTRLLWMAILWVMTVIAVMDWETMLVSDWLVGSWLIMILLTMNYELITMNLLGVAVAVGIIGGIWILTKKKGMGSGDIGIAAVMGLMLGWPKIAIGLWFAFITGAAFGLWSLVFGHKKMKSAIPFGPFLILGTLIASIWGEKILRIFF